MNTVTIEISEQDARVWRAVAMILASGLPATSVPEHRSSFEAVGQKLDAALHVPLETP